MGATIHDVARRAGVSVGTVSNVTNNKGRVSPRTRAKVEQAIRELAYRPNRAARALSIQRTFTLAYLVPDVTNPVFAKILECAMDRARERGYTVVVFGTRGSPGVAKECVQHVIELRVDAVLMALSHELADPALVEALRSRGIAVVGVAGSTPVPGIDCFMWEEEEAGYCLAKYLLRAGHRGILFVGPRGSNSAMQRMAGIARALAESERGGAGEDVCLEADGYSARDAYTTVQNAVIRGKIGAATALVTFNDIFTSGALAALWDQGIMVPRDLSLATFGKLHTEFSRPRITSMVFDEEVVTARAVQRLIDRVEGKYDGPPVCERFSLMLSVQESTRVQAG